ncbi:MAG: serine hydrolase [Desulfobacteraceae bacterium]|nr:serine hydrolase [Desulfobacteraceae bacterium]
MKRKQLLVCVLLSFIVSMLPQLAHAAVSQRINAKAAVLVDMEHGRILFEQNPDMQIAPASITKILTLYLVFEAIKEGHVHLSDKVEVSRRAASTGGSRMGLRAGTRVSLEELIKGMAVVSGNDACVAAAEHISGSVERFVTRMNAKARELGMTNSRFMTPNGLPASGQVTTAHDIARLSMAYLRRFPESLSIHSMTAYTYGKSSHHNANRLLGKCAGVDGLKTGFVCASGYNISATGKRNGIRVLAVVLGARSAWVRCNEAERLLEAGFREAGAPYSAICSVSPEPVKAGQTVSVSAKKTRSRVAGAGKRGDEAQSCPVVKTRQVVKKTTVVSSGKAVAAGKAVAPKNAPEPKVVKGKAASQKTVKVAAKSDRSPKVTASKPAKAKAEKVETKTASQKKASGKKPAPQAHAAKKKAKG